jgi:hypothetical protein
MTPCSNSALNSRDRIIASAISVTENSSKQSTRASRASALRNRWIGSSPLTSPSFSALRCAPMRSCTSAMKSWKWARRLRLAGQAAKKKSISIVLPRPTLPWT